MSSPIETFMNMNPETGEVSVFLFDGDTCRPLSVDEIAADLVDLERHLDLGPPAAVMPVAAAAYIPGESDEGTPVDDVLGFIGRYERAYSA
jgi:hypothetical protein